MNETQKTILRLVELLMKKYRIGDVVPKVDKNYEHTEHIEFILSKLGVTVRKSQNYIEISREHFIFNDCPESVSGAFYRQEQLDALLNRLESEVKENEKIS